jgi:hypothetical protein
MQDRNETNKDRHGRGGKGSPDRERDWAEGENRGDGRDNRGNSQRESDRNR